MLIKDDPKWVDSLLYLGDLSLGGSAGNLDKWLFRTMDGKALYVKGRYSIDTYEPETEVCCYELASLFGLASVPQFLVKMPLIQDGFLSASYDFSNGLDCASLFRYARKTLKSTFSLSLKESRYHAVCSLLPHAGKLLHDSILAFDFIVGNPDRHLRNFELRLNPDGSFASLVEAFDFGEALFSKGIKPPESLGANPYERQHLKQFDLLKSLKYEPKIESADESDIQKIIHDYFCFDERRASFLSDFVIRNYRLQQSST